VDSIGLAWVVVGVALVVWCIAMVYGSGKHGTRVHTASKQASKHLSRMLIPTYVVRH
jgi:hypothetical protein